jgi:uncharacterized protein (UPF0128 family)
MRIGKYVWNVYPEDMSDEEFSFFCEAVELAKEDRRQEKLRFFNEKLSELINDAEKCGVFFTFQHENEFICTPITTENCSAATPG